TAAWSVLPVPAGGFDRIPVRGAEYQRGRPTTWCAPLISASGALMSAAASDRSLRQVGLRTLRDIQPVRGKHFGRPGWLMNRSSGPHLGEVRRYVEDGSAVHSVQVGDDEVPAVCLEQSRIADRQLVGASVVAVDEGSGCRPDRVSPW